MIEQIKTTTANVTGTISHFISDESRGVPYCAVHVNKNGDYWLTAYGSYSFGRSAHQKILDKVYSQRVKILPLRCLINHLQS